MPRPHQDPAITGYVRYVVIGLDNAHPELMAREYGLTGAWAVNVREGHRWVGMEAAKKIAKKDFGGSLERLEAAARAWAAAHPELVPKPKTRSRKEKPTAANGRRDGGGATQLQNLRAARERLLKRGYPRDAVNEALLSPTVQDTSDVLLVFDLAERHLIAHGYAAQLNRLLRQQRPRKGPTKTPEKRPAKAEPESRAGQPARRPRSSRKSEKHPTSRQPGRKARSTPKLG